MGSISKLVVYPLKGAKGIEVDEAKVTDTGLAFDRHFVIVGDTAKGRFETQRSEPRLALIETSLPREVISGGDPGNASLTLTAPGQPPLKVPLTQTGKLRAVKVWDWAGEGADMGDEVAEYLSTYFGKPVRLLKYAGDSKQGELSEDPTRRPVDKDWAAEPAETAFSDAFPLLLANEASLEDLNQNLPDSSPQVPMNRFRPNVIVSGAAAWEEDKWGSFTIGGVHFLSAKPCDRCKVTTTVQETGSLSGDKEPLRTLSKIRTGSVLGWDSAQPSWKNAVFFGWNLIPKGSGVLKVGDAMGEVQPRKAAPGVTASAV